MKGNGYTEMRTESRTQDSMPNGPPDEPDMVPVPPAGCGGCLQDNGTKMLTWKYVGEGQGNFQPRQSYDYVGQGRGSYEKEVIVTPGRFNLCKVITCFCVTVTLLIIGIVAASMLGVSVPFGGMGVGAARSNEGLTPVNFNCQEGLDFWPSNWTTLKKEWCCANFRLGCLPDMVGCNTECNYMRKTATCSFRIQWGANHRFFGKPGACAQAYQMVAGQCPWCGSQCTLQEANCLEEVQVPVPVQVPIR